MILSIPSPGNKLRLLADWSVVIPYDYYNGSLIEVLREENLLGLALNIKTDVPFTWPHGTIFLVKMLTNTRRRQLIKLTVQSIPDSRFKLRSMFAFDFNKISGMDYEVIGQ